MSITRAHLLLSMQRIVRHEETHSFSNLLSPLLCSFRTIAPLISSILFIYENMSTGLTCSTTVTKSAWPLSTMPLYFGMNPIMPSDRGFSIGHSLTTRNVEIRMFDASRPNLNHNALNPDPLRKNSHEFAGVLFTFVRMHVRCSLFVCVSHPEHGTFKGRYILHFDVRNSNDVFFFENKSPKNSLPFFKTRWK